MPKIFHTDAKQIILNTLKYLRQKKDEGFSSIPLNNVVKLVFDITGTDIHSKAVINCFDYLNSGARSPAEFVAKTIENRLFNNVFRDILRDTREPVMAFPVCPALQERYRKHVKECHPTTSKTPYVDFENLAPCNKCLRKRPCACDTIRGLRRTVDKEEQRKRQFEDAIFSWLKDIPVYPNEDPRDKFTRDAIVKKLAETLSGLKNEEFAVEEKEEIERALDNIPMWYPKGKRESDRLKNNITNNLLEKIKVIKELEKFYETTKDFFNDLQFLRKIDTEQTLDDIVTELHKITLNRPKSNDMYRDLLKIKAFELLNGLPIKTSEDIYEYLYKLSDELADCLLNVSKESFNTKYKRKIGDSIRNMLDETNIRVKDRHNVEKELSAIIADVVAHNIDKEEAETYIKGILDGKVPDSEVQNITNKALKLVDIIQIDPNITKIITEYLRDILDQSNVKLSNRDKIEENLQNLVFDAVTKGLNEDKAKIQIKSLLEGKVSDDKVNNITNRVLELAKEATHIKLKPIDNETRQNIKEDVRNILDLSDVHIKYRRKVEEDLSKLLTDISTKGMEEDKVKSHIESLLKGKVPKEDIKDITKRLLLLADQVKPIDNETKQMIKHDVSNILNLSDVQITDREKVKENICKLVTDISTKGMDEDEAKSHIQSLLKGKVPNEYIKDITKRVLSLAGQVKPIDNEKKQRIKHDVRNILDLSDVQSKDREKVEEDLTKLVADITTKGMVEDKAKSHIESILKGKVPKGDIKDITKRVLLLADQVKPIDNETKQMIKHDVRNILDHSDVQSKDREKVEEHLTKLVADISAKGLDEDEAKTHIESLLKGKVPNEDIKDITKRVLSLAGQVKPIDNETKQMIKHDVRNILDLSDIQSKHREKIEEDLTKLVADISTKGLDEDEAKTHIESLLKGKVPNEDIKDITKRVLSLAGQVKPIDNKTKQRIKHDVRNILDLSDVQRKDREKVEEDLTKLVADITTKGMVEDKAKSHIESILKGKEPKGDIKDITKRVLLLADQVKPIDNETKQMIKYDVRNILDLSDVQSKDREKVEEDLSKLVADISTEGLDKDEAKTHIESLLKGKIPNEDIKDITKRVLSLAGQVKPLDNETTQMIKHDVSNILNLSDVQIKDREKVKENISKLVTDISRKGMDEDEAKSHIESLLKGKVPNEHMKDITKRVLSLAGQVKTIDNETKQRINNDVRNILDLSDVQSKDREKVEEDLTKLVADITTKGMVEDKAISHIESILKGNVPKGDIKDITKRVLLLADQVKPIDNETKQMIKRDVRNILDLSDVQSKDRKKVEEDLTKLVADISAKGLDEDEAKTHIEFLLKGKVPNEDIKDITKRVLLLADQVKPIDNETKQMIKNDVRNILDLSDVQSKHREKVEEDLTKLVADISTKGLDEDEAKTHIESLLKGKVPNEDIKDITKRVLSLASQVKPLDNETTQMIKHDVSNILNLSDVQIKDREKVKENISKLVTDISRKGMDEDEAKSHIESLLKGKVPNEHMKDITKRVLSLAGQLKPIDNETKQRINNDVRNILDLSDVQSKHREKVEEDLTKLVADITTKGMVEDKAKSHIESILKGKVPKGDIKDITTRVLLLADQLKPIDNETKQMIKHDVSNILNLSDVQIKDREKVKEDIRKLVTDISIKGMDEDEARSHIESLLKGKVPKEDIKDITNRVLSLAGQVKPIDNETKQRIKHDVRNILDLSDVQSKDREKVEKDLTKLVADIVTKGIVEDKAKSHIESILKGKVLKEDIKYITKRVLLLADQVKPIDNETKQMIKHEVSNILNLSDIQIKDREKVKENISKLVTDISRKGMDEDEAKSHIESLLKGKVPNEHMKDITKRVLSLAGQVKPIDNETKQRIKHDVRNILDLSDVQSKDREKVEEDLTKFVADITTKGMVEDKAKSHIESILKGKVPKGDIKDITKRVLSLAGQVKSIDNETNQMIKLDVRNILEDKQQKTIEDDFSGSNNKVHIEESLQFEDMPRKFAMAEHPSPSLSENGRGPVAHSTQNEEKIVFDQVYGVMRDWLKFRNIILSNKKLIDVAEAIANEVLDRRKYLQLNPGFKTSEAMESEILKEQIYKVLNRLVDKKSMQLIMLDIEDLMRVLKEIPLFQVYKNSSEVLVQDTKQFIQENLEGAMLDWLKRSPIYQNRNTKMKQSQEQVILKLASSLATILSSPATQEPGANPDEVLLKEISKYIEKLDLETDSKSYIHKLRTHLLDYLKSLQLFQNISVRESQKQMFPSKESQGTKTPFMTSTNHLNTSVKDWCEALQISDTDQGIKQDLANKIMIKIGEMNMNQDILNDDLLYDEILKDFIDQQVNELQIDKQITDADKKVLLDQIKQIKYKFQDDFIGKKYKQQLLDSISNVLPVLTSPTEDEKTSFELMKENLVDAFISLNYSVDDDTSRNKFKRRMMDEVNKYVDDYLRKYPAIPVCTKKLNEALYSALKNVPVPDDETMRTVVESVRIKNVINDWLKTLPMSKQSKSEQLHANKIVSLMAQELQELENEFRPDFEEIAVAEIVLYLKKLPLKNKNNLHGMAIKLVEKIKNTAESRAFVEGSRSNLTDDCLCEDFPMPCVPATTYPSREYLIPPCGLSIKGQEITQLTKELSLLREAGTQSRRCRDAAVNPPPLDNGSQTEMPCLSQHCPRTQRPEQVCSKPATLQPNRIPIGTRPGPSAVGQSDLSPCIQVKQYHRDSCLDNLVGNATRILADASGRIFIPSSPLNSECICCPRTTQRRIPVKPRSRLEYPTCRRPTPRRQLSSACPNEYFPHPKHCSRPPPILERDHFQCSCRHVGPRCGRIRSPCLACQENPTTSHSRCTLMHGCPHPTCLYFK